jgi:NitT/TauT family transport system substrate-binding protein
LASLTVVLTLLTACTSERQPTHLTELRIAISPLSSTLPVHIAEATGIFERNGLRVTRTEGQDLPVFAVALTQGRYDIALSIPTIVLTGADRGLDLQVVSRLVTTSADQPGTVWITRDPAIDSIDELAGTTIAVPAISGLITDALGYLLDRRGVDRNRVRFVQIPFAAMADQLAAHRIDVAVAGPPFSTAMADKGFHLHEDVMVKAVQEASGGTVDTGMPVVLASTSTFTKAHPEAVVAFRRSLTEAIDYLQSHEAEARGLLETWLEMPPDVAQRAPLPTWSVDIRPEDLQPYVTISRTLGSIERDLDVDALVWRPRP